MALHITLKNFFFILKEMNSLKQVGKSNLCLSKQTNKYSGCNMKNRPDVVRVNPVSAIRRLL